MSDPKLLEAMAAIKGVLKEKDIAGHVVLHNAPGSIEIYTRLDPGYSRLIGLPPTVRLRSKLAEYKGDAQAQRRDLAATAGMVRGIAEVLATNAMQMIELADWVDAKVGGEHTPMVPDPDLPKR